ncbi:MAG: YqeG family HAD IIIA-type phosphatase [Eubacteriales bacterium]|nr:YqeG family HAD IIIA-type phosphatase [Eubacteriales bacterium]
MLKSFYPDETAKNAYDIDYEKLYRLGCRGLIYDVDNTLVPHGAPADRRAKKLFSRLGRIGFSVTLLSNNKEPRVKSFAQDVGHTGYIFKAGKPSVRGYQAAMEQMGTNPDNTVFIGDQLFTDVWGAKRAKIHSILVPPIHPKEEIQIILKRQLEKIVLYFYYRQQRQKSADGRRAK